MLKRSELLPEHIRLAAMEWRIRTGNDPINSVERAEFEAWRGADKRHEEAYEWATRLWSTYGELDWQELDPALFERRKPRSTASLGGSFGRLMASMWPATAIGALAASMVTALVVSQLWHDPGGIHTNALPATAVLTSDIGEGKQLVLADTSEVTLGPDTRIEVEMSESTRQIRLIRGAAAFFVASDPARTFSVQAESFTARAVGTVFDLRNSGGVVRLSVSEGIVEALHPPVLGREVPGLLAKTTLRAGEQIHATFEHGLSAVSTFDVREFAVWRNDRLQYEDAPLSELIADANRYSERPIVFDGSIADPSKIRVTFSFSGNRVERMLDALPALFPIRVDASDPSRIVLLARETH